MTKSSYISFKKAKSGVLIPFFSNNTASCSMYNPEREAEAFASQDDFKNANYFLIGGCGCGLHVKVLQEKYPNAFICILEDCKSSLEFWQNNANYVPQNCIFCDIRTLKETLKNTYFPPLHGNFTFQTLRAWQNFHSDKKIEIKLQIEQALSEISADISVQSYFGKIWHRNILLNLQLASLDDIKYINLNESTFPTCKKAVICGAGPGLGYSISELQINRDLYFIVSTDTSYQVLLKQNIIADVVITADGQNISINHFMTGISPKTLYVSDLSASPTAARFAYNNHCPILFYNGGHPLSNYVKNFDSDNRFPFFSAGAGSVTIAALDFVKYIGFLDYSVIGADFSYIEGKTYTNGTYLDIIYLLHSSKFLSVEKQFTSLMFRTKTKNEFVFVNTLTNPIKCKGYTNKILESYRLSYKKVITDKKVITKKMVNNNESFFQLKYMNTKFNFAFFKYTFCNLLFTLLKNQEKQSITIPQSLYPYCAVINRLNGNCRLKINILLSEILDETRKICGD